MAVLDVDGDPLIGHSVYHVISAELNIISSFISRRYIHLGPPNIYVVDPIRQYYGMEVALWRLLILV